MTMHNPGFLLEGAAADARQERHKDWTEGLDSYQRAVVETLMDNLPVSVRAMEAENNSTASIAVFNRVARPMITRIQTQSVASELVSIQPMQLPTTKVFFQDFSLADDRGVVRAGDRLDYEFQRTQVGTPRQDSRRFYAAGVVKGETLGTGTGAVTAFNTSLYPIRPDTLIVYVAGVATANFTINEDTGAIVLATAPANNATVTADYSLVMEGLGSKGNARIPKIKLGMSSASVDAKEFKIGAEWTLEGQQDLFAYFGQSMEGLLSKKMADEIRQELDRLILTDLYTAGGNSFTKLWDRTAIPVGQTYKEWYETLFHAIGDVSNEVYKRRLRHANFVVMAPDTINMLDKLNTFRMTDGAGKDGYVTTAGLSAGPNVYGTLNGRYRVIVDPLFPKDKVLVGYKGETWDETGYVYSPYTSFETATFNDPNTMKPVKGLMQRAGFHLVNDEFYGLVQIQNA